MKQKPKNYPINLTADQRFAVWVTADAMMCMPKLPDHEYEALRRIGDQCEPLDGSPDSAIINFTAHQLHTSVKSIELALRYLSGSEQPYGPAFDPSDSEELRECAGILSDLLPAFLSFLGG